MKPFFSSSVWGRKYIDNFCALTLPMHFSSNNIPAINKLTDIKYLIITSSEDLEYFKKKRIIKLLSQNFNIEFYPINIEKKNKYTLISELQNMSMILAKNEKYEILFPFYADVLCSDGTLYNTYIKIKDGYQAVVSLGPQTILSQMKNEIYNEKNYHKNDYSIDISSRHLVKLTFKYLHPFHAPSFWEKDNFTTTPSMIFFRVKNNNVLARGFHLHPVAFKLPDNLAFYRQFYGTLDENFMTILFEDTSNVYISKSSDEVFMCSLEEISGGDSRSANTMGYPSIVKVSRYAERHTFLLHREFIKTSIRLYQSESDENSWNEVEQFSDNIIQKVLNRLNSPDSVLQLEDPLSFKNRKYHLQQKKKMNSYLALPNDQNFMRNQIYFAKNYFIYFNEGNLEIIRVKFSLIKYLILRILASILSFIKLANITKRIFVKRNIRFFESSNPLNKLSILNILLMIMGRR